MVVTRGFEPLALRLSSERSTRLSYVTKVSPPCETRTRYDAVKGRRLNPLPNEGWRPRRVLTPRHPARQAGTLTLSYVTTACSARARLGGLYAQRCSTTRAKRSRPAGTRIVLERWRKADESNAAAIADRPRFSRPLAAHAAVPSMLEATVRIERTHRAFAERSLSAWLCGRILGAARTRTSAFGERCGIRVPPRG